MTFLQRLVDLSSEKDETGAATITFSLPLIQVDYPLSLSYVSHLREFSGESNACMVCTS